MPWKGAPKWLHEAAKREGWADAAPTCGYLQRAFQDEYPVELELASADPIVIFARGKKSPAPNFQTSVPPVSSEDSDTPTLKALHQLYSRISRTDEEQQTKKRPWASDPF